MNKMKLLAAVAVVSGLVATPVLAKDMSRRSQATNQEYSANDNTRYGDRDANYRDTGYRDTDYRDTGFLPGDVAAGVVGGAVGIAGAAVGTAGAIATAPFQPNSWNNGYAYNRGYNGYNNSYASYNGYNGLNSSGTRVPQDSYAQRNGWVCQPGTLFRGEDGRRHICQ